MNVNKKEQKSPYYIELSSDLAKEMDLRVTNKDFLLRVTSDGANLKDLNKQRISTVPLRSVIVAALLIMIGFFLIFRSYNQIPMTGNKSIATLVIVFGSLTGMINFIFYFIKDKRSEDINGSKNIFWRNLPTVLLAYSLLSAVALLIFFKMVDKFFYGVTFDIYTASFIGALLVSVVNYAMIYAARTLTPSKLIKTLIYIILGGVTIAIATNRDQQWWLYNLSFLGTPEASNSWQFNLTLMFSALLMVALIDYLFVFLYDIFDKSMRLRLLKGLLFLTALSLGGVGFFPYNDSLFYQSMHNRMAGYLVYLFLILIVLIRWLIPSISQQFLRLSYGLGFGLLVSVILFQVVDYLSLTAFELIAFVLAFSWLLLLFQTLVNTVMYYGKEFNVVVKTNQNFVIDKS